MRLYLSSFGLGNRPEELLRLLSGGKRVAVVLNAKDLASEENRVASLGREMDAMRGLGLEPTELDLRDYFGDAEGLRGRLRKIDLVWVRGGNAFVLRRALRQSGGDAVLTEMLGRDEIVYAGFSAAVAVLVPSMRGLELVDDAVAVPEGYEAETVWEGLGLLSYTVAPHYRSDHPESEAIDRCVEWFIERHVPFVALRDGEAIVVDGARHEVVS